MRSSIIFIGMVVNGLLLIGLIYLNYRAPSSMANQELTAKQKTFKIAIISPSEERNTIVNLMRGFVDEIKKEAQFTPHYKVYNANDSRTLMRSNIDAAIGWEPDLLVTLGAQATQMTKELTEKRGKRIPTIFIGVGDPLKLELIDSLESSGNHLTGVTAVGYEWVDNMIDLLPILAPHVKRVFVPYDPTGLGGALEDYKLRLDKALARHHYEVSYVHIFKPHEVAEKVPQFLEKTDMILILPDAVVLDAIDNLYKLSCQYGLSIYVAMNIGMLERGATFAYGYYSYDMGVCAAHMARTILEQGVEPSQIPIDRMTKHYHVALNVDNARSQNQLDKFDKSVVFLMEHGQVA